MAVTQTGTMGQGPQTKQVTVNEVDPIGLTAQAVDTEGQYLTVRLALDRTGILPRTGDVWMADRTYGKWTLAAKLDRGPRLPCAGSVVLAAGTALVEAANVTATTLVLLTSQANEGTPGTLHISALVPGASFTIASSSALDTSTVAWLLVNP